MRARLVNLQRRTRAFEIGRRHYDLGNDFFEQFLDPLMMYSSAIYPDAESTLEEAARFKIDHICRKLDLRGVDDAVDDPDVGIEDIGARHSRLARDARGDHNHIRPGHRG